LLGILTAIASIVFFALKGKQTLGSAADSVSVGLMIGFIGTGLAKYIVQPNPSIGVPLIPFLYYIPHAYNLVIWSVLSLLVLRPRFGPRFLIAFALVYGIDELLWNSVAYIRFGGSTQVLTFLVSSDWEVFITGVVTTVLVSYALLRPRITPNWTWPCMLIYVIVYAGIFGMPSYAVDPPSLGVLTWELMWQGAVWFVIYWTFWPRSKARWTQGGQTWLPPRLFRH
jgi:hypothetical protein